MTHSPTRLHRASSGLTSGWTDLRRWLFLAVLLADSAVAAGDGGYAQVTVQTPLQQVSEHVWLVQGAAGSATENQGFVSNAGFVVTEQGVIVIDALGSPSLGWALRQAIRRVTDKPVTHVVLTHYHADHAYGAQVFKDEGAQVLAPAGALDYLDSDLAQRRLEERRNSLFPWVDERTRLVRPDTLMGAESTLDFDAVRLNLIYLGAAHSEGDLAVLVEPDRVLFSGDIIFEGRTPFVGNADTQQWLDALKRMESMRIQALIPGHGAAAADPTRMVAVTRRYIEYLRTVMGEAVDEMVSFDEAYAAADWSEFSELPAFDAANRRNAFQVYLAIEEEQLAQ